MTNMEGFGRRRLLLACMTAIALFPSLDAQPRSAQSRQHLKGPERPVGGSLPFGPKQLPSILFGQPPFTGAYVNAGSAENLTNTLALARRARIRLILKLAGSRTLFQNANGSFSLELWKRHIDRLRGVDLAGYVADGTVIGAELLNEPHDPNNWGGTIVSKEQLESAARYAKSIWPYLPVGAGRSDYLLKYAPWEHLDFGHSQYHMRKGNVGAWLSRTIAESIAAGVGLLLSINFYAGEVGDTPMTAEEVRDVGLALAADSYACALTGYVYDEQYLSDPEIRDAMAAIASVAASHRAPPCHVGSVRP